MDDPSYKSIKFGDSSVIFKTLFVRFIRHSEGAVIVVVVARYIYPTCLCRVIGRYIYTDMLEVEA